MFKADCMKTHEDVNRLKDRIAQLESELAEARKDQARYLRLIDTGNFKPSIFSRLWDMNSLGDGYSKEELDAPIDSVINEVK